ncbi:MAG: hypothetical protein H6Q89_3153 [Myxococcaceae bacterium]|nr:hypothetical protein [Myxococcaceae bacterium]
MGTLKTFIDSKGITPKAISLASRRVEAGGNEARSAQSARSKKRRLKMDKPYAELAMAKPKSDRALSESQVTGAVNDKPLPKKVRAKVLRAINALLATKKQPAVDMKALFEGVAAKPGKKAKEVVKAG